jgi:hypothetical protein
MAAGVVLFVNSYGSGQGTGALTRALSLVFRILSSRTAGSSSTARRHALGSAVECLLQIGTCHFSRCSGTAAVALVPTQQNKTYRHCCHSFGWAL